jgi:hypothetical protein
MAELEASWELTGEGKESEKERRGGRGAAWEGGQLGGRHRGRGLQGGTALLLSCLCFMLLLREEEREQGEEGERRGKKEKEGKEEKKKKKKI